MIHRLLASLAFATLVVFAPPSVIAADTHSMVEPVGHRLFMFDTERAAQRHCPRDAVVWLNTNSGIYLEKGMRYYGNTKHGAYVCRREADAAGDRGTRNGQ